MPRNQSVTHSNGNHLDLIGVFVLTHLYWDVVDVDVELEKLAGQGTLGLNVLGNPNLHSIVLGGSGRIEKSSKISS